MWRLVNKWGSIIIVVFVLGVIAITMMNSAQGISTWISDHYLPKRYLIIEYGGMRFIMYGQFDQVVNDGENVRHDKLIEIVKEIMSIKPIERSYTYPISVNFESDFNSKQVRSTDRSSPVIHIDENDK